MIMGDVLILILVLLFLVVLLDVFNLFLGGELWLLMLPAAVIRFKSAAGEASDAADFVQDRILLNRIGTELSRMAPSGKVLIDDVMYDAVSEGQFLLTGQEIQVVGFDTGQLIVRLKLGHETTC